MTMAPVMPHQRYRPSMHESAFLGKAYCRDTSSIGCSYMTHAVSRQDVYGAQRMPCGADLSYNKNSLILKKESDYRRNAMAAGLILPNAPFHA